MSLFALVSPVDLRRLLYDIRREVVDQWDRICLCAILWCGICAITWFNDIMSFRRYTVIVSISFHRFTFESSLSMTSRRTFGTMARYLRRRRSSNARWYRIYLHCRAMMRNFLRCHACAPNISHYDSLVPNLWRCRSLVPNLWHSHVLALDL